MKAIRKVARVLCLVAFLMVFGFVGGMETGGAIGTGAIGCLVSLAAFAGFGYIGGLFH